MPESQALVRVAAELLGADVGTARSADLDRQALLQGAAAEVLPVEDIARALIARAAR